MNKRKILIVDDEADLIKILKKCLERTGNYEIRTENQSTNAIASIRDFKPDLILLDMIMPKINGDEIAAYVQADKQLKHIKIVFFTATTDEPGTGIKSNIRAGNVIINKPVKLDKLIDCFEEQLS